MGPDYQKSFLSWQLLAQSYFVRKDKDQYLDVSNAPPEQIPDPSFTPPATGAAPPTPMIPNPNYVTWIKEATRATAWLHELLDPDLIPSLRSHVTLFSAWDALDTMFRSDALADVVRLKNEWSALCYPGFRAQPLDTFFNGLNNLAMRLELAGVALSDSEQVYQVLAAIQGLPELAAAKLQMELNQVHGLIPRFANVQQFLQSQENEWRSHNPGVVVGGMGVHKYSLLLVVVAVVIKLEVVVVAIRLEAEVMAVAMVLGSVLEAHPLRATTVASLATSTAIALTIVRKSEQSFRRSLLLVARSGWQTGLLVLVMVV